MSGQSGDKIFNVLFLCTGNSARSIMAEAILAREGLGRFRAFSAGSRPSGEINPHVLKVLKKLNHPTDGLRSKSWDEFTGPDAPEMNFVFTVCDETAAMPNPQWPGHPLTAHWGVADPAACQGDEVQKALLVADVYRMLTNRIGIFVSLPFRSLDRLALKQRLSEIGRSELPPAVPAKLSAQAESTVQP